MKKPELFNKTIDVLVKAYLNDTLEHMDCCACAIGNLVAAANGYEVIKGTGLAPAMWKHNSSYIFSYWDNVHTAGYWVDSNEEDYLKGLSELKTTGYSKEETIKIERAFERSNYRENQDPQYVGLMAVLDVLQAIHECSDEEKEGAKLLFVKS